MKRLAVPFAALCIGLAVAGCQGPEGPTPLAPSLSPTAEKEVETPATIEAYGAVGLGSKRFIPDMPAAGQCTAHSSYSDIEEGVQVSISDSTGKVVGVGNLEPGTMLTSDCAWKFRVDVPAGGGFYKATVLDWESELVAESDLATEALIVAPAG
ncbi:hypothetical protein ACFP63_08880 [Oerskovia jenensis]|uniref:Lipoprotein antigen n=1 Tax=Oerskovia jenensis TaxID=162169 RepID=A0ABS2LJ78_9CELL|nr:hypothetical protein [Oerskovia jenensis]MBM7480168.1 hypothetical protein [Oerskovia jenensis]